MTKMVAWAIWVATMLAMFQTMADRTAVPT
jgi:hypothetical protein